jgi:enhancing lycopene biosynthesis protein 2
MAKRVGVILSGCGVQDGSEIHEAVITLLELDKAGAEAVCIAPSKDLEEVNHLTGELTGQKRCVFLESARIARGNIKDIKDIGVGELDAVILPGGYGAAKNLSTFAAQGSECQVDEGVARLLRGLHSAGKPIGALCIAPVILARLFGPDLKPELTIGTDPATRDAIEKMGARHRDSRVTEIVIDRRNKIVTTPAYMLANSISEVASGVQRLVQAVLELC